MKPMFKFSATSFPENFDVIPSRGHDGLRLASMGDAVITLRVRELIFKSRPDATAGDIQIETASLVSNNTISRVILQSNILYCIGLPPLNVIRWLEDEDLSLEVSERSIATAFESMIGKLFMEAPKKAYALIDEFVSFARELGPIVLDESSAAEEPLDHSVSTKDIDAVPQQVSKPPISLGNDQVPLTEDLEHEGVRSVLDSSAPMRTAEIECIDASSDCAADDVQLNAGVEIDIISEEGWHAEHDPLSDAGTSTTGTGHKSGPPMDSLETNSTTDQDEQASSHSAPPVRSWVSSGDSTSSGGFSPLELSPDSPFARLTTRLSQSLGLIDVSEDLRADDPTHLFAQTDLESDL